MNTALVDLLVEGLWLTGIGLAIVFAFLLILVGLLTLMSKALTRWAPQDAQPAYPAASTDLAPSLGDERLIAAIAAGVHEHRKWHRR